MVDQKKEQPKPVHADAPPGDPDVDTSRAVLEADIDPENGASGPPYHIAFNGLQKGADGKMEPMGVTLTRSGEGVALNAGADGKITPMIADQRGFHAMTPEEIKANQPTIDKFTKVLEAQEKKFETMVQNIPPLDIHFDIGKTGLTGDEQTKLAAFVAQVRALQDKAKKAGFGNLKFTLPVSGMADTTGNASDARNQQLADERQKTVMDALKTAGLDGVDVVEGSATIKTDSRAARVNLRLDHADAPKPAGPRPDAPKVTESAAPKVADQSGGKPVQKAAFGFGVNV